MKGICGKYGIVIGVLHTHFHIFILIPMTYFPDIQWTIIDLTLTVGLPLVFVSCCIYERKEEEIDGLVMDALSVGSRLTSDIKKKLLTSKKND